MYRRFEQISGVPVSPASFSLPTHPQFPLSSDAQQYKKMLTPQRKHTRSGGNEAIATGLPPQINQGATVGQMALEWNAYREVVYLLFLSIFIFQKGEHAEILTSYKQMICISMILLPPCKGFQQSNPWALALSPAFEVPLDPLCLAVAHPPNLFSCYVAPAACRTSVPTCTPQIQILLNCHNSSTPQSFEIHTVLSLFTL